MVGHGTVETGGEVEGALPDRQNSAGGRITRIRDYLLRRVSSSAAAVEARRRPAFFCSSFLGQGDSLGKLRIDGLGVAKVFRSVFVFKIVQLRQTVEECRLRGLRS